MTQHSRFDQAVQAYAEWVLRWRWPILLAVLLLTALAASATVGPTRRRPASPDFFLRFAAVITISWFQTDKETT